MGKWEMPGWFRYVDQKELRCFTAHVWADENGDIIMIDCSGKYTSNLQNLASIIRVKVREKED